MPKRSSWILGAVIAIGAVAAVPLAQAQTLTASSSAEDLKYRLSVIDAELADIRARLGATGGAATTSGSAGGGGLVVRLDRLEAELRQLTGQVEQLSFEQRRIGEEAARRFSDVEFRLTELEGGDISTIQPVEPLGGGSNQVAAVGPEVSISERNELTRAIDDVKQGRFDQGEDRLQTFLTSYPGSPLRGEALYWMGESQFVRGAFQNAARSFLDGYNADRSAPVGPQSLYRLGVTLGRLGQFSEACLTLNEVRLQFPNGPADILGAAADESRSLNCG